MRGAAATWIFSMLAVALSAQNAPPPPDIGCVIGEVVVHDRVGTHSEWDVHVWREKNDETHRLWLSRERSRGAANKRCTNWIKKELRGKR